MAQLRFSALDEEGPIQYTCSVLEVMRELSTDPDEKADIDRQVALLRAHQIGHYRNIPRNIGIIDTKEDAMLALSAYLGGRISKLDCETRSGGKDAYGKKVEAAFCLLAKKIDYQGKWEVLAQLLVRRAAAYWNW